LQEVGSAGPRFDQIQAPRAVPSRRKAVHRAQHQAIAGNPAELSGQTIGAVGRKHEADPKATGRLSVDLEHFEHPQVHLGTAHFDEEAGAGGREERQFDKTGEARDTKPGGIHSLCTYP